MLSMLNDLYKSYGYIASDVGNGHLYSTDKSCAKTVFWLVIQEGDLDSLADRQSELFGACKQVSQDSALDKNISMLVLWETGGNLDIGEMKKKVMMVEEDAYVFKKHVLYYSSQEYERLRTAMGEELLRAFLENHIASQNVFSEYKKDPLSQGWQPLLYRIAIKVPFVDIHIDISDGLTSLFEMNEEAVKADRDKELVELDRYFFDIKDVDASAEDYLAALLPVLEGMNDGD